MYIEEALDVSPGGVMGLKDSPNSGTPLDLPSTPYHDFSSYIDQKCKWNMYVDEPSFIQGPASKGVLFLEGPWITTTVLKAFVLI